MKSSILRAGFALACALGLSACGGGSGDLPLSGTVSNVTKDGLVLRNEGNGDETTVVSPYSSFAFSKYMSTDDEFNIVVKSLPSNASACTVNNGKARANYYTIAQISVNCTIKTHALNVTVNGLNGAGLVLNNGADRQNVAAGVTKVTMTPVSEGGLYGVTIYQQPSGQTCSVANGSGIVAETDVNTVVVNCAAST
jgi:hypothetical protein